MDVVAYDTRVGAYVVLLDDEQRLLLPRWIEGNEPAWTMPGGGVELEESPPQAAVREVREETGDDIELVRLLGFDTVVQQGSDRVPPQTRTLKSLRVIYEGRIAGGTVRPEINGSTDQAKWVPIAEVSLLTRVTLVDAALALYRQTHAAI